MTTAYTITPKLRIKLKEPFGNLIQGAPEETMDKMKELVEKEKPPKIISVGDIVSRNLHKHNIHPQLTIIDNISLRNQPMPKEDAVEKTVYADNPQGTITQESILAVKEALARNEHTHIVVRGEEDLLTLIAVLYAPENAFVVYGQPHLGIVVVKVTSERKAKAQEFLNAMKSSKS
ncbi:MAG: GTP-dependent dephospho-CoA kinase family protein [Candidatus Bathyarchaeota archaeon]|nr:GTP-dependent dephospho-CoA kinase family protein [Candidatus Bathyarchaeota archaeon]